MKEIVLKMGRTGKSLIFFYVIFLFVFLNCFRKNEHERYTEILNKNRKIFEKAAIAFSKQDEFSSIARCSNSEYVIDASRYFIKYQKFDGRNTVNKNQVVLELETYSTSDYALSIFSEKFFFWIDFLRRNNISGIEKAAAGTRISLYYGLFFSESGLLYVPPEKKSELKYYHPFDPNSGIYVTKIDSTWYYYCE